MSCSTEKATSTPSCGGCSHCGSDHSCGASAEGTLVGWRMSFAAVAVFLLPLALAATGAVVAGAHPTWQFAGAMIGLAVGVAAGLVLARFVRRQREAAE